MTCECPNYAAWADVHLPQRGGNLHLVGAEGCVAAKPTCTGCAICDPAEAARDEAQYEADLAYEESRFQANYWAGRP